MLKLLVIDDHPVIRGGVRDLLRHDDSMRVAAEAASGAEALVKISEHTVDAVLLDLSLPDIDGADLIPLLRHRCRTVPIIIFTNDETAESRCMGAGASAFVTKHAGVNELRRVIVASARTQPATTAVVAKQALLPHMALSKRELQIMLKLVSGMRPKAIALQLDISEKTVATHRARVLRKLGVDDNRALLIYAVRAGLTDWS